MHVCAMNAGAGSYRMHSSKISSSSQQGPRNRLSRAAGAAAPSGGSEPHEVGSVGVNMLIHDR
jgi:hypothetical protein